MEQVLSQLEAVVGQVILEMLLVMVVVVEEQHMILLVDRL